MSRGRTLIIGYGIVGQAVYKGCHGERRKCDVLDPPKDMTIDKDYDFYDRIIICVPTPMLVDGLGYPPDMASTGKCDDSLVRDYVHDIRLNSEAIPILIKSTTSIDTIHSFKHDLAITYNPEFLTEHNANEDFRRQKFAIFGGNQARYWHMFFRISGIKFDKVRYTDIYKAAYAKYTINCFLAVKVIFFNQLREMYGDYNFDQLTEIIAMDERIGPSHMMVPGPDGVMGYGGMCFPKDTEAFAYEAREMEHPLTLLEHAMAVNNVYRFPDNPDYSL